CSGTLLTRIETFDGVPLDVNVTLPPASMNGPFPLIVDIHGWGVGKSPQPFTDNAAAGYITMSYSARGFHFSCGLAAARLPDLTIADPNACNDRGWIRLADARYEVRDTQYLAGLLADAGLVIPSKVAATGSSYGGGQSMMLAALRNRVMMPDGSLVPWTSPNGTPMEIAAAAPLIPWSDLGYALVPNGRTLDYRALNPYGTVGGVEKTSWVTSLYTLGLATGFFSAPGADPDADITTWRNRLDAGEPYDTDPVLLDILDEVTTHHSAYYIDDSIPPAPLFIYNAFTDDLFPATEALRFYNKTRAKYPSAEISLMFADAFGHPRASLAGDMTNANQRVNELFAYHLKGVGAPLADGVETYTQACGGSTAQGPYAAPDWESIHPGEVRLQEAAGKSFGSAAGDPSNAQLTDPVSGGALSCRTTLASVDAAAATYQLPAATGAGYTLMGSPTVIAHLAITGTFPEAAARLWDVGPDSSQALVSQGFYRPIEGSTDLQVFQLPANGWKLVAGHVFKLELLGQSAPFGRASNGTFTITVTDLDLRLPVVEVPDGGVVQPPEPPVVPGGGETGTCGTAPLTGCRVAGAARILVKDKTPNTADRLQWKWFKGAATTVPDFGTPQTTTSYALCVYDGSANLLASVNAPAGGICHGKPCWRSTTKGFRYDDKDRTPDGVQRFDLKSGVAGKAQIQLKAQGIHFVPPTLPISNLPVVVQLRSSAGQCWQSTHTSVLADTTTQFKAK
ncbi:MAG: CocE/NonD family hydrolase, partial [Candidatus Binatia bacterium]